MPSVALQTPGARLDLAYLESTLGYAIRRAQLAVFQDIYRAFAGLGVSTAQFSVLAVVADNPGINQAELAAALAVERPRMVPLIDALEQRDLVRRVADAKDRRHRRIHLSAAGEALLAELKQRFAQHQQRLAAVLGEAGVASMLAGLWRLARETA